MSDSMRGRRPEPEATVQLRCVVPFDGYRKHEKFTRSVSEAARLERKGFVARVEVAPPAAPVVEEPVKASAPPVPDVPPAPPAAPVVEE